MSYPYVLFVHHCASLCACLLCVVMRSEIVVFTALVVLFVHRSFPRVFMYIGPCVIVIAEE